MTLVATQVKRRRGTGAENDAFTGAEGEITVDLTNKELRVHTGDNKVGGYGLARKDFENITDEAKNISNWSSNVSNCITNIPQDIKLELNNGTLTLKAGSKVYVPNGVGVFDEITIASDLSKSMQTANNYLAFYRADGTLDRMPITQCFSGSSAPTGYQYMVWYDTTNNLIKYTNDTGSTWTSGNSFPICEISPTSINQTFNGFGYIGSTIFALPGVKGLGPNGKNADGTLKSIEFAVPQVLTTTPTAPNIRYYCTLSGSNYLTAVADFNYYYDAEKNYSISDGNTVSPRLLCVVCVNDSNNKIIDFKANTAFHAVDYSDYIRNFGTVIEEQLPTANNNYTWYRKYAGGWVEQGRRFSGSVAISYGGTGNLGTFTFPIPMADTFYFKSATGNGYCYLMQWDNISTTSCKPVFGAYTVERTLSNVFVYVCGKSAS